MRTTRTMLALLAVSLLALRTARPAEDEKAWKPYIETGSNYARAAEDATNSRDRRDNIERAAGQFQAAVNAGKDTSNWRPLVLAADGYMRLAIVATGNDKDNYTDLANAALDSAVAIAKSKAARGGLREAVRVYRRLARITGGEKLKTIEAKIQAIEHDEETTPGTGRRTR